MRRPHNPAHSTRSPWCRGSRRSRSYSTHRRAHLRVLLRSGRSSTRRTPDRRRRVRSTVQWARGRSPFHSARSSSRRPPRTLPRWPHSRRQRPMWQPLLPNLPRPSHHHLRRRPRPRRCRSRRPRRERGRWLSPNTRRSTCQFALVLQQQCGGARELAQRNRLPSVPHSHGSQQQGTSGARHGRADDDHSTPRLGPRRVALERHCPRASDTQSGAHAS